MINDAHIHTSFSTDCQTPPEDVVLQAIKLGMSDICITDHYDADVPYGKWTFDTDEYFECLSALREKYKDRINVHIGIEVGLQPHLRPLFEKLFADHPFELVIGSIHILDNKDPYYRDEYDMTDDEYFRAYFKYSAECFEACRGLYDTIGHLDYVVRYAYKGSEEYSYEKYAELIDPILDIAAENGAALEINTGGLYKGAGMLHPADAAVKKFIEKGGRRFTVGSDAHRAADVGRCFDTASLYLKARNITEESVSGGGIFLFYADCD